MYHPEQESREPVPDPLQSVVDAISDDRPQPLEINFVSAVDAIVLEVAKPIDQQDRTRVGYWRQAGEAGIRNHDVNGEGYCELGPRVRCLITKHAEGLDIVVRPHSIFDNRCQMFFVRPMSADGSWNEGAFVLKTPVLSSQVTEETELPFLDELDGPQTQALYSAIAAPSVER